MSIDSSMRLSGYQVFMAVVTTAVAIVSGLVLQRMIDQASLLGDHAAQLRELADGHTTIETSMETSRNVARENTEHIVAAMERLERRIEANSINLPDIIARLGVVEREHIFDAAIYNDAIWAFPKDAVAADRLQTAGIEIRQVNHSLFGYRLVSLADLPATDLLNPSLVYPLPNTIGTPVPGAFQSR